MKEECNMGDKHQKYKKRKGGVMMTMRYDQINSLAKYIFTEL